MDGGGGGSDDPTGQRQAARQHHHRRADDGEQLAIVGDLMRSISAVRYYPRHQTLEEVARDYNANWTTAVEMLTDDIYLGGENWNNLFVLRRNPNAPSEEVRCRLDTVGEFHLGEMCNKFMSGSLVMPSTGGGSGGGGRSSDRGGGGVTSSSSASSPPDGRAKSAGGSTVGKVSASHHHLSSSRTRRPAVTIGSQTLFATVDGTIGSILGLDVRTFAFLSTLEAALSRSVRSVGDLSHAEFRTFEAERRVHPSHGFVDGDMVESFLDLDRTLMEVVVREMNRDGGWDVDDHGVEGGVGGGGVSNGGGGVSSSGGRGGGGDDDNDDDMASATGDGVRMLTVEDVVAMVEEMSMLH